MMHKWLLGVNLSVSCDVGMFFGWEGPGGGKHRGGKSWARRGWCWRGFRHELRIQKGWIQICSLHISHWYRALQLCSSPFFWGWESLPRLDFGSPCYVGVCYCPSSGLRCTVGGFYCYYLKFILIFLKSVFKRISLHQPCWYKSMLL